MGVFPPLITIKHRIPTYSLNSRYTTTLLPVGNKPAKDILASLFETDGDTVGADKTIEWVLKYLTENYKDSLHAELRKLKLIPKLLDEYEIAALIDHANLDITEWRSVVQALKAFQNVKHIGASVDKWTEIGKAAGEVKYDEWIYSTKDEDGTTKHEKIKYWWKDPVAEVTSMVASILNGYADLNPDDIAFIYVCHGGDHGKAKFRFTTKLIIQFKDGGPCIERLLPVGDILCKKDSAEVLRGTLIPKLAAGVNRLANEHLIFKKDDEDKWCVTLGAADPDSIKPESFIAGDLAYLACLLGKDGFEGDWCNWCKSYNTTWHDPNCRCDPWTIDGLKDQATANETESLKGTRRMGVKTLPPFFDIPVENIIFSVLHAQMGIGNKILDYLVDEAECNVEKTPAELTALRNDVESAETALAEVVAFKNGWTNDSEGGKKLTSLKGMLSRRKKKLEQPNLSTETVDKLELEIDLCNVEIKELRLIKQNLEDDVQAKMDARTEPRKQLEIFKKHWKADGESVYSGIDKILEKYGICRSAYHGGKINGVDVQILMRYAPDIMNDVKDFLLAQDSTYGEEAIALLCEDCVEYLVLWDAAFAAVHVDNPDQAACDKAQLYIDLAMFKHRQLKFRVTPKTHGMEKHVVSQMLRMKILSKLIEHWVEHYHQIGSRYDLKWINQSNELKRAVIRARREFTASHPEVLKRKEIIMESLRKRKTPDATVAAAVERKRIKTELRAKYVDAAITRQEADLALLLSLT
eukprot:scaffold17602_cov77-Skeletonema_dohrnii-CCMP3373.AAC.2